MFNPEDLQARAYFRRGQVRNIVYEDAPPMGGEEHLDMDTHVIAVNFMTGHHCLSDTDYFKHMSKDATAVLATLTNAMKHLEDGGKTRVMPRGAERNRSPRLADAGLEYNVTTVIEAIPSQPDAAGERYCAGYRFHWILREKRRNGAPVAAADDPPQDADDEEPIAATVAQQEKATRKRMLERIREFARRNPLAYGLACSFAEAYDINQGVVKKRIVFANGIRAKKGDIPAAADAVLRIQNADVVPGYQFAAFETMERFVLHGIIPFYTPATGCERAIPVDDPGNAFLSLTDGCEALKDLNGEVANDLRGTGLKKDDYFVSPKSPLNPDRIFCLERAMAYMMRAGSYRVAPECCRLLSYNQQAVGHRVAAATAAQLQQPLRAIVRPARDGDGEEEAAEDAHGMEDDSEDANFPSLRTIIDDTGKPWYNSVARGTWPFPRLTWCMNSLATYAEILCSVIRMVIGMNEVIPKTAFRPVDPNEARSKSYLPEFNALITTQLLKAIQRLQSAEAVASSASAQTLTTMSSASTTRGDEPPPLRRGFPVEAHVYLQTPGPGGAHLSEVIGSHVENVRDPAETLADVYARRMADEQTRPWPEVIIEEEADGSSPKLKQAGQRQVYVVRKTLSDLVMRYQRRVYAELTATWAATPEPVASDSFMPLSEFHPAGDVHNMSGLTQSDISRRCLDEIKNDKFLSQIDKSAIIAMVDIFPAWQIQRNELLEQRGIPSLSSLHILTLGNPFIPTLLGILQMSHARLVVTQEAEIKSIKLNAPREERDAQLAEAHKRHMKELDKWNVQNWRVFDDIYNTTERVSPALLDVRNYAKQHVYPDRNKVLVKPVYYDVRPNVCTQQFFMDTYRSVELVTKQNFIYMARAHVCTHHSFRWMPRREDPALNLTLVGEAGAGKSFCLKIATTLTPDGVVQDTTSETTASCNVEQDFDGHVVIYQEMDSNLLYSNKNKNDTGATDKINFAKARMTSFFTRTKYFHTDETTGKRTAAECFSSQHIVTMGATNQKLDEMDKNMKRRLLIDYVSEVGSESDGSQAHELIRFMTSTNGRIEKIRMDHRELYCAYVYVESAIKMGVIHDLLDTNAIILFNCILKDAHTERGVNINSKGHRTWVLEAARILSIQNACYRGLFSPEAFALYASDNNIQRWTPQAFHKYIAPQLFISKEALIHALTMFDFLYASRDDDRLLGTIALRLCHLADKSQWRFRHNGGPDATEAFDYNYLSFTAASVNKIGATIAENHKHIGKYRAEDIRPQIGVYEKLRRPSLGFTARFDQTTLEGLDRIQPNAYAKEVERPAIIYEYDTTSSNKKPPMQFSISIEFLESRFKIDIINDTPAQIIEKIERPELLLEASLFDRGNEGEAYENLQDLLKCVDARAPLISSIRKVFSMPTLEGSRYEHDQLLPLPRQLRQYWTFYLPDDVCIRFDNGRTTRVAVDGTPLLLEAERDPLGKLPMIENYAKPLPTARLSMYQCKPNDSDDIMASMAEMSRGYVVDKYDVDFYSALEQMRRLGHPGLPELHSLFIEACVDGRDLVEYPSAAHYKAALFKAIPILDPAAEVPLPFAFPPIAYRIEQYLARKVHKWPLLDHYPACNVYERLQDTALRTEGREHDNANGAYDTMSERYDFDAQDRQARVNIKRAREAALVEENARSERPEKRARLDVIEEVDDEEEEDPDAMNIDGY